MDKRKKKVKGYTRYVSCRDLSGWDVMSQKQDKVNLDSGFGD